MVQIIEIETNRLILRQWKDSDFKPFSYINSDKRVMEFFPSTLSRTESDTLAELCQSLMAERGWGIWALEEKASKKFVGFTGLHIPTDDLPFSPCVEIAWRLSADFWGQGLATEAATEALRVGFENLHLKEIVSFTARNNVKSLAVMARLKMVKDHQDFEHPSLPLEHPLRVHTVFRLSQSEWKANQ